MRAVVHVWSQYRRVRVELHTGGERRIVRTPFVFVGNNEYELEGVKLGGRKALNAGFLHLCMAPGMTRLEVLGVLLAASIGRSRDVERFESFRLAELSIGAWRQRLPVSIDGELTVLDTPLQYRIRPGALRVLVPSDIIGSQP